jgi:putative spermidine/putrescine transport system ATP-binding protein
MNQPALRLEALQVGYNRHQAAVRDLHLTVGQGELLALLGPSGCGKTTTMRAIAGLLEPSAGKIILHDVDVTRLSAHQRDIGLVFQSYALFPHLTVFENVAFGLRVRRVARDELQKRVLEALDVVGLADFTARFPAQLSGGQQQRVALARAFVIRPKLLLLDEPLSNLDAQLRLEMRSEIRRLQRHLGASMLYVTHDQAEALALADRVAVMNNGQLEQLGTPETMYAAPRTVFAARFMGFENILPIRIAGTRFVVGELEYPLPNGLEAMPDRVAWRSSAVQLGASGWSGRVQNRSFEGQLVEYQLETPLGLIRASVPSLLAKWREGENLTFALPVEQAVLLRD